MKKQVTYLSFTIGLLMTLTACGGGDNNNSTTTTTNSNPVNATVYNTPTPSNQVTTPTPVTTQTQPVAVTTNVQAEQAVLNLLNEHRQKCGFGTLTVNQNLKNTASNHANYLKNVSETNRSAYASHYELADSKARNTGITNPYYSGEKVENRLVTTSQKGSQAIATSYHHTSVAENIGLSQFSSNNNQSQNDKATTAKNVLQGLLSAPYHMKGLLSPKFNEIGVSYQEAVWVDNGSSRPYVTYSILEMVSALPLSQKLQVNKDVLHYPCDGIVTEYQLDHEEPDPFINGRLRSPISKENPSGQPIYVLAPDNAVITHATATMKSGSTDVKLYTLTKNNGNDPHNRLDNNEVIFIPATKLNPNTNYSVKYNLIYNTGEQVTKEFIFKTKPQQQ